MKTGLRSASESCFRVKGGRVLSPVYTLVGQSGWAIPALPTPNMSAPWENASETSSSSHIPPVVRMGISPPIFLQNSAVIGTASGPSWVFFVISQQDRWRISIPSAIKSLDKSRLSSIVMPQDGYVGDILTAIMKLDGTIFLIVRTISIRNLNLFFVEPPQSSSLRLVLVPRN